MQWLKSRGTLAVAVTGAALVLIISGLVAAQGGYRLAWYTVDGGGGAASGRGYALRGTGGQPDTHRMSGRGYALAGGFWQYPALEATPTPTSTSTSTPTVTPSFTATPSPTATGTLVTPTPTATADPATPSPTATETGPTPTPTASMTPGPTRTPDPSLIYHLYLPVQLR